MHLGLIFFVVYTAFAIRTVKQLGPDGKKASQAFPQRGLSKRTVSLSVAVDIVANAVTLSWAIVSDSCLGDLTNPTQTCASVKIYIPPNLSPAGSSSTDLTLANSPTFVWNVTNFLAAVSISNISGTYDRFRTRNSLSV